METVPCAKEEVPRDAVVGIVAAKLRELGNLYLIVPWAIDRVTGGVLHAQATEGKLLKNGRAVQLRCRAIDGC